jgi:hypothetical protein
MHTILRVPRNPTADTSVAIIVTTPEPCVTRAGELTLAD